MIEILHDIIHENHRNDGGVVYIHIYIYLYGVVQDLFHQQPHGLVGPIIPYWYCYWILLGDNARRDKTCLFRAGTLSGQFAARVGKD